VDYEPAESSTGLFGGNSNWRGPIWFPINFLLIESLQKFHHFYGDGLSVELPTGSGRRASLWDAAAEISRRLTRIFLRAEDGTRPVFGGPSEIPDRTGVARPHLFPRILSWRQRRRHRGESSDGLDGAGRQAD
jgi:Mannosyl oligosaccharide glucosidase.